MKSMTGFGKEMITYEGKSISIEIRTLNSKQLDINTRISSHFKELEITARNIISASLIRGKVDLSISIEQDNNPAISLNRELVKNYYAVLSELSTELNNPITPELFIQTLKMPQVIGENKELYEEKLFEEIIKGVEKACKQVEHFRISEGNHLAKDLACRVKSIQEMISEIIPFEQERLEQLREKIRIQIVSFFSDEQYDKNRFEEELIYYIEKLDITEEKVRLGKHCDYFLETMQQEDNSGKKLGFIAQEIGREINTIGSKANHFNIQQIVVRMKDELEKIKEQLSNIL